MSICFSKSKGLYSAVCRSIFLGLFGFALRPAATAQSSPDLSFNPILSQASQAFSSGQPVLSVEMTGTAKWTAGSTKDSGPVKLTAKITGENTAEFDLSDGIRTEKQSALAEDRTCTWSGKDGVEHNVSPHNCWIATVWFLPHLALQNTRLPSALGVSSASMVSEKAVSSPHIQHQLTISPGQTKPAVVAQLQELSKTDLILDRATSLPTTLRYNIHPDDDSTVNLKVEVRFSDYKNVSGVELPMHIERYVNGSLQLSIDIDSATVN